MERSKDESEGRPKAASLTAEPGAPQDVLGARQIYQETVKAVGQFFAAADKADAGGLSVGGLEAAAGGLYRAMDEPHQLVALAVGPYPDVKRFVLYHSVNVAILSQRVARAMELGVAELQMLCLAALVHDVGSVRIPEEIFYKPDSLSEDEWDVMRERPRHSFDILSTLGGKYRAVAEIAHQVHERLDGSGYPRKLKVDSIFLEASILGAVDIFEAFIHPRPYKKTVPAAAMYGVDNLMRLSHQFGDGVLKALVRSVGLFPVGTYVRLNSGEIGKVLESRPGNPMRPKARIVYDTQKRQLAKTKDVDLMQSPHLYVFRPVSNEDLRDLGLIDDAGNPKG